MRDFRQNVSVIVLNFNRAETTLDCLGALCTASSGLIREIIVVDNGSMPIEMARLREGVGGRARLIEVCANRFFGEGNNIGAEEASGEFLVFLNNDAFVQPGWLDEMVQAMVDDHTVAAVGAMLCYPDGRVQEVGGLVLPTGDTVQIGKGAVWLPDHYTEIFPVDYCSASCLLMSKRDFFSVGGFSYEYEPAYYEDVDLCLKIWATIGKVVVNPRAKVVHLEAHTTSDRGLELEGLVELNRQKFLVTWRDWLWHRTVRHSVLDAGSSRSGDNKPAVVLPGGDSRRIVPPTVVEEIIDLGRAASGPETIRAAVYTPYELVPGGGERVLVELCECLSAALGHRAVVLATPYRYSATRLSQIGRAFGFDQLVAEPRLWDALENVEMDLNFVLGNAAVPPVRGRASVNIYICQFPFVTPQHYVNERVGWLDSFDEVWVYSEFARRYMNGFARFYGQKCPPIRVMYPPAAWSAASSSIPWSQRRTILNVGRFFTGDHDKRQDVVIDIVRGLADRGLPFELALAGSVHARPRSRSRFRSLVAMADGLSCTFYPNAGRQQLADLYGRSAFLVHAAGYGVDRYEYPERLEHFGITPVEAASFGCIPLVYGEGGPPEAIRELGTSTTFRTPGECIEKIVELIEDPVRAEELSTSLPQRAEHFSSSAFRRRVRVALEHLGVTGLGRSERRIDWDAGG